MEVSEQINSVINNLSAQIGGAVTSLADSLRIPIEEVMKVMVKQAYVHGVCNLILIAIAVSITIYTMVYIFKNNETICDLEATLFIAFCLGVVTVGGLILIASLLGETMTCLFNPEYWVLQEVLNMIKPAA